MAEPLSPPSYALPAPIPNPNCAGCGGRTLYYPPLVVPGAGGGNPIEIDAGPGIDVQDLSTSELDHFIISQIPITTLSAALSLVAKAGGVAKSNPILQGTAIDQVIATWSYNGVITSQVLNAVFGGSDSAEIPILASGPRTSDFEASIEEDATFTITGNNGQGFPTSIASSSAQVLFGNHVAWGDGASLIGEDVADLQAFFDSLSKAVQRSKGKSLTTTGGLNEYFFYLVPVRFGEVTFTKGIFPGGYRQLLSIGGVFVPEDEVGSGDVIDEILIENDEGFTEAYRVYMSLYDNQDDPDTPTVAS